MKDLQHIRKVYNLEHFAIFDNGWLCVTRGYSPKEAINLIEAFYKDGLYPKHKFANLILSESWYMSFQLDLSFGLRLN